MGLPPRSSVAFWGFSVALATLTFVRLDLYHRVGDVAVVSDAYAQSPAPATAGVLVPLPEAEPPTERIPGDPGAARVIAETIGPAGSIYLSLKAADVSQQEIARVGQALDGVFDAQRESKPGDALRLVLDGEHAVLRFEYTPAREPDRPVLLERIDDRLVASRPRLPLAESEWALEVVIEDNLSNALSAAGETEALTDLVLDYVYGSVIDFHKDPRRGDRLGLVYTRLCMGDRFVRYGRILLAQYDGAVVSQCAIYYGDPAGGGDYYDAGGRSLDRMFLLKPMEFRRISSRFNRSRYHPILKRNMPHLGTDYAAAVGTQVWSTARGRVVAARWNGGYGKMVEVAHEDGFRTRYAHLSRILVKPGQRVDKHTPLGLVGATGRATGPHLHYELLRAGRQIDPATVNHGGPRRMLPPSQRDAFLAYRSRLESVLEKAQPVSAPLLADAGVLDTDGRSR